MFGYPVPKNIQHSHGGSSWHDRFFPSVPFPTASHPHACIPHTAPSTSTYRRFSGQCVVPWVAWSRCCNSKCSCGSRRTAPTTRQSIWIVKENLNFIIHSSQCMYLNIASHKWVIRSYVTHCIASCWVSYLIVMMFHFAFSGTLCSLWIIILTHYL